jgi:hypothetical protein
MMSDAAFRMREQSPSAVIDEYTDKVKKLAGVDGKGALALELAERAGARAYWNYQQGKPQQQHIQPGGGAPVPPGAPPAGPGAGSAGPDSTAPGAGGGTALPPPLPGTADAPSPPPRPPQQLRPIAPVDDESVTPQPGRRAMHVGGYMLGIGLVVGLGSIALIAATDNSGGSGGPVVLGLVGLTVGAILVVVGLFVLIVGALIAASD